MPLAHSPALPNKSAPAGEIPSRLRSLDLLRGMAIAGMILVLNPGSSTAVYPQLEHAGWEGATATDMIFPTFLWVVGAALPFSLSAQQARGVTGRQTCVRVLRRAVLLLLLGLLLNGFPGYHLRTLRIPGVLERIALCYGAAAPLALRLRGEPRPGRQVLVAAGLAGLLWAGYAALLVAVPVPGYGAGHLDPLRSLPAFVDRAVFTPAHLWPQGVVPGHGVAFDPEGLLSTLPALGTTLAGMAVGYWVREAGRRQRVALHLAAAGTLLLGAGLALSPLLPVIKKLWTPSFALLAAGVSTLLFAGLYAVGEAWGRRLWTPLIVFGTNSILAFCLSGMLIGLLQTIQVHGQTLQGILYGKLFASWLQPRAASLSYGLGAVLVNGLLLWPFYRRRIFFRL